MSNSADGKAFARPTVLIENEVTRVTRWTFPQRGTRTGWHRHAHDYVVIPEFTGILEIDDASGDRTRAEVTRGVPYFRRSGVEHDVVNGNDFACSFVEVEFLR